MKEEKILKITFMIFVLIVDKIILSKHLINIIYRSFIPQNEIYKIKYKIKFLLKCIFFLLTNSFHKIRLHAVNKEKSNFFLNIIIILVKI